MTWLEILLNDYLEYQTDSNLKILLREIVKHIEINRSNYGH